jgi:hypothetical protein
MKNIYILCAIALVATGVFFVMHNKAEAPTSGAATEHVPQQEMPKVTSTLHSLKDFLAMNVAQKCTYTRSDATMDINGTTYVDNGKVRTDTVMTDHKTQKVMHSQAIIDAGYMYAWSDSTPFGVKMQLAALMTATSTKTAAGNGAPDVEAKYDYNCAPGAVDGTVFVPPTNIEFKDMSAMMQQMMGKSGMGSDSAAFDPSTGAMEAGAPGASKNAAMCGACAQAPNAQAQAQCKIALGCK